MPKVILISGGSDGLGKALAKTLSKANQVVILAHNRVKLEAAAKEIGCDFVEAEMTNYSSLKSAADQVITKYQRIDVLINNAGIWTEGQLETNDPAKIKEIIDVNTTGTIFLTKAVLSGMRQKESGQIINVISKDGLCAKKERSVYSASKWAITGFTKCLQEDLAEENIKVTGVYPGLMRTSLFQKDQPQRDLTDALEPSEVATLIEYVVNLSQTVDIPEITIKNKTSTTQTMDDTNAPAIDLNIDPDLITPQGVSPQVAPGSQPQTQTSVPTPPVTTPGIIDITPRADTAPVAPTPEASNPIIPPVAASPSVLDTSAPTMSAPVTPEPETAPVVPETPELVTEPTPVIETPSQAIPTATDSFSVPSPLPPQTPNTIPSPETQAPVASSASSIAEDPDLVKLVR